MNLHNGFSAGHSVVVHLGIEKGKASRDERFHLVRVELIPHPDFERARDDRDVFP